MDDITDAAPHAHASRTTTTSNVCIYECMYMCAIALSAIFFGLSHAFCAQLKNRILARSDQAKKTFIHLEIPSSSYACILFVVVHNSMAQQLYLKVLELYKINIMGQAMGNSFQTRIIPLCVRETNGLLICVCAHVVLHNMTTVPSYNHAYPTSCRSTRQHISHNA